MLKGVRIVVVTALYGRHCFHSIIYLRRSRRLPTRSKLSLIYLLTTTRAPLITPSLSCGSTTPRRTTADYIEPQSPFTPAIDTTTSIARPKAVILAATTRSSRLRTLRRSYLTNTLNAYAVLVLLFLHDRRLRNTTTTKTGNPPSYGILLTTLRSSYNVRDGSKSESLISL